MVSNKKYDELFERSKRQGIELQETYRLLGATRGRLEDMNKLCDRQRSQIKHLSSLFLAMKVLLRSSDKIAQGSILS